MIFRRFVEILRLYLISPEVGVILATCGAALFYPEPLIRLGCEVASKDSVVQYIALIPVAILTGSFKLSKEMLRPLEGLSNKVLYEWNNYWRIKYRALAPITFCFIASLFSIGIWIFKGAIDPLLIGCILVGTVIVSAVTILTQFIAYLRLREILQGGS